MTRALAFLAGAIAGFVAACAPRRREELDVYYDMNGVRRCVRCNVMPDHVCASMHHDWLNAPLSGKVVERHSTRSEWDGMAKVGETHWSYPCRACDGPCRGHDRPPSPKVENPRQMFGEKPRRAAHEYRCPGCGTPITEDQMRDYMFEGFACRAHGNKPCGSKLCYGHAGDDMRSGSEWGSGPGAQS